MAVAIVENPASPLKPGSIDLFEHDRIHLHLKKGFSLAEEADVVGFTMGNDASTSWLHLLVLKIAAYYLYQPKYRLTYAELKIFDRGVRLGIAVVSYSSFTIDVDLASASRSKDVS